MATTTKPRAKSTPVTVSAKKVSKTTKTVAAPTAVVKKKGIITRSVIWLTIAAGFLLVIANSAAWVNHTIFDAETFTEVTKSALLSETSTHALAAEIVDTALADRPIVKRIVGDSATNLVAGLLNSSQVDGAVTKVVERIHTYVTGPNPQNVEFELAGIKSVVVRVIDVFSGEEEVSTPRIDAIPDTLTLINADNIPPFYQMAVTFLWLGPLALIGAVIMLVYPYLKNKRFSVKILAFQGTVLVGFAVVSFLVGPLFRPPVLSAIADSNYRVVVGNLYNAFIATFNAQSGWLLTLGLLMVCTAGGFVLYRLIIKQRTVRK